MAKYVDVVRNGMKEAHLLAVVDEAGEKLVRVTVVVEKTSPMLPNAALAGDDPLADLVALCAEIAQDADGGVILWVRLTCIADAFRIVVSACMWIMRMVGNNHSHYEASYFANLVAKPTLVASMHNGFDVKCHVLSSTNGVMDQLGKMIVNLVDRPTYVLEWASCGVKFNVDGGLASPGEAKRSEWLGTGPNVNDDMDDEG
ncbi:hypothetical protein CBR_g277 [Chara braunii]|uniref:Uncharacterized protein n=1 Tax=Chara braunii TaxID=69332 RepID=A0A388JM50_CHABU|nr:hypothetical protein CBR_g277 [Chara braunii]|eukprot:GBG58878.1 hypothetical protein CBR_g277 [Chara braunii]